MARIRTIKPEFWSSKTLAKVSRESRLTFIGLWSLCDDLGITLDTPKKIAGDLYPYEDITGKEIDAQLDELYEYGLIVRVSENNKDFIIITSWDEHQKVDRPSKFTYLSRDSRERLAIGSGKREKGSGKREAVRGNREIDTPHPCGDEKQKPKTELELLKQHDVDGQLAKDFLAVRKKKRLPLTKTAMDGITEEAAKAKLTVFEAITISTKKGWGGFDSSWDWPGKVKFNGSHGPPTKGMVTKINYGGYVPSKEKMDAMKTIDGEIIHEQKRLS